MISYVVTVITHEIFPHICMELMCVKSVEFGDSEKKLIHWTINKWATVTGWHDHSSGTMRCPDISTVTQPEADQFACCSKYSNCLHADISIMFPNFLQSCQHLPDLTALPDFYSNKSPWIYKSDTSLIRISSRFNNTSSQLQWCTAAVMAKYHVHMHSKLPIAFFETVSNSAFWLELIRFT